jgi:hypothetical protein
MYAPSQPARPGTPQGAGQVEQPVNFGVKPGQPTGGQRRTGPPDQGAIAAGSNWGETNGYNPSDQEIWETIKNNLPADEETTQRVQLAAGYWNDPPQAPPQPQDPWGVGGAGPKPDPTKAGRSRKDARPQDDDEDEDDEPYGPGDESKGDSRVDYSDDDDNEDERDDDDEPAKPSFFAGVMASVRSVFARKGKASSSSADDDDDDDDDDEDDDDEEDGDLESPEEDAEYEDEEFDDNDAPSSGVKNTYVVIGAVVLALVLATAMFFILRDPLVRFLTKASSEPTPEATEEVPEPTEEITPEPQDVSLPPNQAGYRKAAKSGRSSAANGYVAYCASNGIHLLTDEYVHVRQLTETQANAVCMDGYWVYYSTADGISRVPIEGGAVENIVYEDYFEPITFHLLDGFLYYPSAVSGGIGNLVRRSEDATEHAIILEKVGTEFLVDEYGAYGLGPVEGAADTAETDAYFTLPEDAGAQSQYLCFSNILAETSWRLGLLPATELLETKSQGVIVKAVIDGRETGYFSSSDSTLNTAAPIDYFYSENAYYELVDYGLDLALVAKDNSMSPDGATVAAEIQKFGYTYYEDALYYFKPMTLETMVAYNMWKFDFKTGSEVMIVDFGKRGISIDALSSWNFDKISPELIAWEGYLIRPETGGLSYIDRANGSSIEFKD